MTYAEALEHLKRGTGGGKPLEMSMRALEYMAHIEQFKKQNEHFCPFCGKLLEHKQ